MFGKRETAQQDYERTPFQDVHDLELPGNAALGARFTRLIRQSLARLRMDIERRPDQSMRGVA